MHEILSKKASFFMYSKISVILTAFELQENGFLAASVFAGRI